MESAYDYESPVIQGLLDTDYYTFTMMQAVLHQHPNVDVEYNFIVRAKEKLGHLIPQLRDELEKLAGLQMREGELRFLFNPRFREYLTPITSASWACSASTCATSTSAKSMAN